MMEGFNINIGLFGPTSVGKTTFLNAMIGKQLCDMEIQSTKVPEVYFESVEDCDSATIKEKNKLVNNLVYQLIDSNRLTNDKYTPVYHHFGSNSEFFRGVKLDNSIRIHIYDLPGMSDSVGKESYLSWVKHNIAIFDIIIFITDITKGLYTSTEIEILKLLFDSMTRSNALMICLINKCDGITYDATQDDMVFEEKEDECTYVHANSLLKKIAEEFGFCQTGNLREDRYTPFIPISSKSGYTYHSLITNPSGTLAYLDQLPDNGTHETRLKQMSKEEEMPLSTKDSVTLTFEEKIFKTGYCSAREVIRQSLREHQMEILINRLYGRMQELSLVPINGTEYLDIIKKYLAEISHLESIIREADVSKKLLFPPKVSYDEFWKHIKLALSQYTIIVNKIHVNVLKGRDLIDLSSFDSLHSTIQDYCVDFNKISYLLRDVSGYPETFFQEKKEAFLTKLFSIYDQLLSVEPKEQPHLSASNVTTYLKVINDVAKEKFDIYAEKFLSINCSPYRTKYLLEKQETELLKMIKYICGHSRQIKKMIPYICQIMAGRQIYLHSIHKSSIPYLYYLMKLKHLITQRLAVRNNYHISLEVLLEITKKNISVTLSAGNLISIYKQELDYQRIRDLFLTQVPKEVRISTKFENDILTEI